MSPGGRAASRARLLDELREAALAELAEVGAAQLSLRSVARRLDLVPSALYRYVASRDALLTLCILDAYRRLGDHVEAADARSVSSSGPDSGSAARWIAVGHAVRGWAQAHPAEWGLLFGTPVVGYRAPQETVEPATTLVRVLAGIIGPASGSGSGPVSPPASVGPTGAAPAGAVPTGAAPAGAVSAGAVPAGAVSAELATWLDFVRPAGFDDVPDDVVALAVIGWVHMLGGVSLELFGQYGPDATPAPAIYDYGLRVTAGLLGLT